MNGFSNEELIAKGYRRISNAYCLVARIDRPDWLKILAMHLHRSVAEFYIEGTEEISNRWPNYYRRVLSEDVLTLGTKGSKAAQGIPSSDYDPVGYIAIQE
jgi:hypothetical protein